MTLGRRKDVRIWRMNTGVACNRKEDRFVRFGLKGQADLTGVVMVQTLKHGMLGVRLEVECKKEGGRMSKDQKMYAGMIQRNGGIYICASSAVEAERLLQLELRQRGFGDDTQIQQNH